MHYFQSILVSVLLCVVGVLGGGSGQNGQNGQNPGSSPYPTVWKCPPFSQAGDPLVEEPSGMLLGNNKILCVYTALGACMYSPVTGIYIPTPGQNNSDSKDDCPDQLDSIGMGRRRAIKTERAFPVAAPRAGPRATIPQNLKKRSEVKRARK